MSLPLNLFDSQGRRDVLDMSLQAAVDYSCRSLFDETLEQREGREEIYRS